MDQSTVDTSYKIDSMSAQLATCPQCLAEMDVKKLRSHVSNSCPNKLITCPELNCGCQLSLKHLRRHLALECEITMKRRKLVAEAEQRKEQEAQRLLEEAEERRRERQYSMQSLLLAAPTSPAASCRPGTATSTALVPINSGDFLLDGLDSLDLDSRHTICSQCGESMRQSQLSVHLAKKCAHRRIMCPNYHSGCKQGLVPLYLLQVHLSSECAAEKHREAMITRSIHRQEIVKCPACGELLPLMNLRRHEKELCANRRVPCRNHALGCTVMVRLRERALHEQVDGSKAMRPALYLPSHGAHLAIREDDIPCPWTAEYWIYRPPAKESLKGHLRNIFLLLPKYNVAFAAEVCVYKQVMRLVRALKNLGAANDVRAAAEAGSGGKVMSKEQRAVRARELAQQRMDMVNSLSALVPLYSEAVLAYTRAFQELAVSVEAGCQCAEEVTSEIGFRDTECVSLQVLYPGQVATPPTNKLSFGGAKGKGKDKVGTETGTGKGKGKTGGRSNNCNGSSSNSAVSVSSRHSQHSQQDGSNASSVHRKGSSAAAGGASQTSRATGAGRGDEDSAFDDADMFGAEGDGDEGGGDEGEEGGEGEDDDEDDDDFDYGGDDWDDEGQEQEQHEQGQGGPSTVIADGAADDVGSAVSSATGRSSQASSSVHNKRKKGRQGPPVDFDGVATYIHSGSALSSLFKACLHLEHAQVLYEVERRFHAHLPLPSSSEDILEALAHFGEAAGPGEEEAAAAGGTDPAAPAPSMLLHPDLDLEYLLPPLPARNRNRHRAASENDASSSRAESVASSSHHSVTKISAASISKEVLELRAQGISSFLADVLIAPRRAAKTRALSWGSWQALLHLVRRALKTDFDALQAWRVDAGLLKPDVSKGVAGGKAELTAKQEKVLEKKEKARLKREMKKQEKQPVGIQNSNASGGSGVPVPVPGAIKKDDGLFKRVGELLKAGCGAGVLAESTCVSRNELSSHSRICLSLDSGLSLLLPGAAGEWEVQQRPLSRQSNGSGRGGGSGGRGGGEGGGHESDADAAPGDGAGDGETEHGDHHYDLLLRPQEMTRLVRCSGKIGIVTIPHTLGETTGMSDYQLQQLAQQESGAATAAVNMRARSPSKKQLFDPRVESPPRSPGSPGSSKAQRKRGPGGSASAGADGANSGSTAAQAAAGKKASSMVRLGVEARSFEVAVPRGKWTHIALVATALPQNKLTLYMDGLLVKTLKDCAFPLPMNALGGCGQSFESFDGALLDVRYWGVQRSSVQIVDNMHKLLDLEVDGIPTLTGNSQGLVAWWTFEDGAGKVSVTDVTGHRFKTLIERRQAAVCGTTAASAAVGIVKGTSTVPITATAVSSKNKLEESRVGAAGAAATNRASSPALGKQRPAVESEMEGFFTHEEAARAGLPEEVRHMLPAPFLRCLPVHATGCNAVAAAGAGVAGGGATSTGMDITGERKSINSSSPWEVWLGTMPKWSWLDAETLPTPKALNMPSTVATTEKARSATKGPPQLPKSPTPGKNSEGPAEQQEHHHPIPPASAVDSKDPINGISSTTSATERPVRGLLPVPSLRARGVCPYELRRHRLATSGRELQREVDCPLGCDEKVKMVDVRFHVRYVCVKRMVACRFDYCSAVFPLFQRGEHEHSDCKHFYARERVLSLAELHTTMFPCSLCSAPIMQRDMATHEQHQCPHRLVPCRYADCSLGQAPSMEAHLLTHHLRFQCDSPTRKERFMLVERARARLKYPRPWGIDVSLQHSEEII